jgi:signal transduction histidine kinase
MEGRERVLQLRTAGSDTLQAALHALAHHIGDSLAIDVLERGATRMLCDPVIEELTAIAREALTNILWHANATQAIVTLDFARTALTLSIRDNGRGFGPALLRDSAKPGHFGLQGMRERAAQLGASLRLANAQEGGAEVIVRVPGRVAYIRSRLTDGMTGRLIAWWQDVIARRQTRRR